MPVSFYKYEITGDYIYIDICKDWHLYIAFIDLKVAFDSVDYHSLWTILRTIVVLENFLMLFSKLYDLIEWWAWANGKGSRWFFVKTGVKQGCVAIPDLFNCVTGHLMTQVCQMITGVRLGNYHLPDLEYTDDTPFFSDTVTNLVAGLSIFQ